MSTKFDRLEFSEKLCLYLKLHKPNNPLEIGRKFNVHKMLRRRPGHFRNVVCTFNLHPVPRGKRKVELHVLSRPDF